MRPLVKLLSVALMNEPGAFAHVATTLANAGVNIEAWVGDSQAEVGVARLLVDDPDKALDLLKAAGHPVQIIRGVKLDVKNQPGELAKALQALGREQINVHFTFGSSGGADRGECIFFVDEGHLDRAKDLLGAE